MKAYINGNIIKHHKEIIDNKEVTVIDDFELKSITLIPDNNTIIKNNNIIEYDHIHKNDLKSWRLK